MKKMCGYAVYKKNLPGPIEVIRYDRALSDLEFDALVEHLTETHHGDIVVRLMKQSELDEWLRRDLN